jgi:hypothetical protein
MASDVRYQVLLKSQPDAELTGELSEIHVRESVEQQTEYSARFAVDVCKTDFAFLNDDRLNPGDDKLLSILAIVNGKTFVLAHGVIVHREVQLTEGGPGSWIEVQAKDRRTVMDRNSSSFQARAGRVDDLVTGILRGYDFEPDVEIKNPTLYDKTNTLNQTGSDLALLKRLAGQQDCQFWLSWEATPKARGMDIVETGHFRPSPKGSRGGPQGIPFTVLAPVTAPTLSLNKGDGQSTLISFHSARDPEAPNQSGPLQRVDVKLGRIQRSQVDEPPVDRLGDPPPAPQVQAMVRSAGDVAEAQRHQEAALNDASWTIKATAETSANLLGGLVRPHDVVKVRGTGQTDDGDYFVFSVEHTINPAEHRMTMELRRNAVGRGTPAGVLAKVGGF